MQNLERIDFAGLVRATSPNCFLVAPEGLCKASRADEIAPVFAVPAATLRQAFLRVALAKPRVSHVLKDDAGLYDNLVVVSALFRFPDLVGVRFIDLGDGRSTLALYSRSVVGHWDIGVNRSRSLAWLRETAAGLGAR
jgi:uncharacterized protein (DUF1499 family)